MRSPQLRLARSLYHEWRLLPDPERERLAPLAREVKDLALDLRGVLDFEKAEAELAFATEALARMLVALPRAA